MKKQTKNILIILTLIVVVLGVYMVLNGQTLSNPFVIGSSTLSIQQASLQSTNPFLSGKVWLLSFSAGGLGQSYYGTFSPSDVETVTAGDSKPTNAFTINTQYADTTCSYPITNTVANTPIYDVQYKTWGCVFNPTEQQAKTGSGLSSILYYGHYTFPDAFTCFAVGYNTQSPVGSIQNPNKGVEYDINLNVNGNIATAHVNTLGSTSGQLGNYAYYAFNGNLESGISCPSQADYKTAYVNGVWRTISSQSYGSYIQKVGTSLPGYCASHGHGWGTSDARCVNDWYNEVNTAVTNSKVSSSFGILNNPSSLASAIISVTSPTPLIFPVTTLYIKADTLGIYTPVPNIKINSASSACFKTGEQGLISASLSNIGDSGTFTAFATCNSPFVATQNYQGSLNSGETKTVNLPLSATASQKTNGQCIFTVQSTGGTKTYTVGTCVDPQITCTSTTNFCGKSGISDAIYKCSSDGATKTLVSVCGENQFCDVGVCKDGQGDNSGDSIWDTIKNFFAKILGGINNLNNLLRIIKWIVLVVAVLFSFVVSKNILFNKFIKNRKDNWIGYVVALLIAGAVGVVGYTLLLTAVFWFIVAGYIVFLIIINLTPLGATIKLLKFKK